MLSREIKGGNCPGGGCPGGLLGGSNRPGAVIQGGLVLFPQIKLKVED